MQPGAFALILFRLGFWIPLLVCTWLALVPAPPEHPVFQLGDVILHAGAFVYLSFALVLVYEAQVFETKAFESNSSAERWRLYLKAACWLLLYGAALEIAQYFLPPRMAEWKDLAVDGLGIFGGLVFARILSRPIAGLVRKLLRVF